MVGILTSAAFLVIGVLGFWEFFLNINENISFRIKKKKNGKYVVQQRIFVWTWANVPDINLKEIEINYYSKGYILTKEKKEFEYYNNAYESLRRFKEFNNDGFAIKGVKCINFDGIYCCVDKRYTKRLNGKKVILYTGTFYGEFEKFIETIKEVDVKDTVYFNSWFEKVEI